MIIYIKQANSQYINETFDLKVDIAPIGREVLNMLPVNITAGYHFYMANLLGREVFLCSTDSSAYTPGKCGGRKTIGRAEGPASGNICI